MKGVCVSHLYTILLLRRVVVCLFPTAAVPSQRPFPSEVLEIGAPNLLVTAPGLVCVCVCVWGGGGSVWVCVAMSIKSLQQMEHKGTQICTQTPQQSVLHSQYSMPQ